MPTKKKKASKKKAIATPPTFTEHVDLMKLIYGSCGSCPSSMFCGSAEVETAIAPKAKQTKKRKVTKKKKK